VCEKFVGCLDVLGNDPYIGEDRHEVGVASPARHNVHVEMISHPRSGLPAKIHTDIKPVGRNFLLQHVAAENQKTVHLHCFILGEVIGRWNTDICS
jgi:hypothetical protein